ncbi:MAG: T9SS type A sorting domain-containing protein [Bacteroidetes bacterium]|nr:MAG: T9SS type A sorting domain-containing protein [Bacteroidota bacterium]
MIFKLLKRFALIFLMAFVLTQTSSAQLLTDFIFSYSTEAYTQLGGGTDLYSLNNHYWSGQYLKSTNIGFPFVFDGVTYTQCNVSDEGWVSFRPPYSYDALWLSPYDIYSMTDRNPAIYCYGGYNCIVYETGNGWEGPVSMKQVVSGSAPYRVCIFQWNNVCPRYYWWNTPTPKWGYQIKIYETTNKVEIHYDQHYYTTYYFTACVGLAGQIGSNRYQNVNPDGVGGFSCVTNNPGRYVNSLAKFNSFVAGLKFKWARPELTAVYPANNTGYPRNITVPALNNFGVSVSRPAGMTHYVQYEVTGPKESTPSQVVYTAWDAGSQPDIYLPASAHTDPGGIPDYYFVNATGPMAQSPGVNGDFFTGVTAGTFKATGRMYEPPPSNLLLSTKTSEFSVIYDNDLAVTDIITPLKKDDQLYPIQVLPIQIRIQNRGINDVIEIAVTVQFFDKNMIEITDQRISNKPYLFTTPLHTLEYKVLGDVGWFTPPDAGDYYIRVSVNLVGPTDQLLSNNVLPRVGDEWKFNCAYEVELEATTIIMPSNYDFYSPPNTRNIYVNKPYRPEGLVTNYGVSDVIASATMDIYDSQNNKVYHDEAEISNAPSGKYNTTIVPFNVDWIPLAAGQYKVEFTVYHRNDPVSSNNTKIDYVNVIDGMCGTFTIGTGGNFSTFDAAINSLFDRGVSCPVTFYLTDTYYTVGDNASMMPAIDLTSDITGVNETNTITFKPSPIKSNERGGINSGVTVELRSGIGVGIQIGQSYFSLSPNAAVNMVPANYKKEYANSKGYFTFDGGSNKSIRFVVNMNNAFQSAFYLKQGTNNTTIKNCIFENASPVNSGNCQLPRFGFTGTRYVYEDDFNMTDNRAYTSAIVLRSRPYYDINGANTFNLDTLPCTNNKILNNEISGYGVGIVSMGVGVLWDAGAAKFKKYYNSDNEIANNLIYNVSRAGIFLGYESNSKVLHNRIYNVLGTCGEDVGGILAGGENEPSLFDYRMGYNNFNLIIGENEINNVIGTSNAIYNYPQVSGIKVQQSRTSFVPGSGNPVYFPDVDEHILIRNNAIWDLKSSNDKTSRYGIHLFTERMPVSNIPAWDNGYFTFTERTQSDVSNPAYFSRGDMIYNNTIIIGDDAVSSRGAVMGIATQHVKNAKIYNNAIAVLDNLLDATCPASAGIFYEGIKPDLLENVYLSDKNAIWVPPTSSSNAFGFIETKNTGSVIDNTPEDMRPDAYKTLRQWYFWTGQDVSSVFENWLPDYNYPVPTLTGNLRIKSPVPVGSVLNNRGNRLPDEVPIDIDGVGRTSGQLFDIGADEFDGTLWLSDIELLMISAPGAYRTNNMPLVGFGDAEHIMTQAPIDVKVKLRNNGNNHQSGVDVNLKIYIESNSGLWIENPTYVVIDTTIKVDMLSGTTQEFSFGLANGFGNEFVPQTYSELPTYLYYDRFASMLGNITPRYKMKVHVGADQKNVNNDKEIVTRFYLKQSHTLNMIVSGENSYHDLWLEDNLGITRIASDVNPSATFTADEIAGAMNYQYLTGESSNVTGQTGLAGIGWFTNIYRDDPTTNTWKIDVLDRSGWEPKTVNYTLYRHLFWSDGLDKPVARYERKSIVDFLTKPVYTEAKQNLFIASQDIVRELTGYGLNTPANDPNNPIDKDFVYTYLRAQTNSAPYNSPEYVLFDYVNSIPPVYGVKGINVGRDLVEFITSTHGISLSYSQDQDPMPGVLSLYPSGEGLARTAYQYIYNDPAPPPTAIYNHAPFGVATTTLSRNAIVLGADWRHFGNTERVLRSMLDFAEKNGGAIIPVELVSFDAQARAKNVDITWSTASEYNTDRFEIEKASLAETGKSLFNRIADVKAAGNSSELKNYGFVDSDVEFGNTYIYRLKTVDLDGKSQYSDERKVEISADGISLEEAYPNPADNKVSFRYSGNLANLELVIFDINGKPVTPSYQIKADVLELDIHSLSNGNYTLVAKAGDMVIKRQFNVVK